MKVEVLETFKMAMPVKNLKRATKLDINHYFYKGDTFECDKKLANLLLKKNLIIVKDDLVEPKIERKSKKTSKSKKN